MYEDIFPTRLAQLRTQKGVSARDMSLSIGQNPGYINNIETGKALPSMAAFFFICEYLDITPQDFFDVDSKLPNEINTIVSDLKKLTSEQLKHIGAVIKDLAK